MTKSKKAVEVTNPQEFDKIYQDYYHKSFLFVKSYVQDKFAAEDIATDSLVKLWEIICEKEISPIRPFLFTILKNKALDYLQQQNRRNKSLKNINEYLIREQEFRISNLEACDPSEIFSTEIYDLFQNTLAELPEKTRNIFILSRMEGKSNNEIAIVNGISVKGVDYHIAIALKKLRKNLKEYLPLLLFLVS